MNKNKPGNASTFFRRLFAALYPFFVSIVLLALSAYLFNLFQHYRVTASKKLWKEKANLLLASIKAKHNLNHLIRDAGNNFAQSIENAYPKSLQKESFNKIFNKHFAPEIKNKISQRWAFVIRNKKPQILPVKGFENTHRWVMTKVFSTLISFSQNKNITYDQIQSGQKFLKNVFGPWSAPLILGRNREGIATPIIFSGKNQYLYWRKIKIKNKVVAGIITLFPEKIFKNRQAAMKMIATQIFTSNKRKMAAAFVPCQEFKSEKAAILPEFFYRNKKIKDQFLHLLAKVKQIEDQNDKQMQFIDNHVFLRGMFSEDSIYDAVVFSPLPAKFKPAKFPYFRVFLSLIGFWAFILFAIRMMYTKYALPLKVSFRIFFFLTGLLPICFMLIAGFELIEANYQAKIIELKQNNRDKLSTIDARSDAMLPLFSRHLARIFKRSRTQEILLNNDINHLQSFFASIKKELEEKKLNLNFMYAYETNKEGKLYLSENIKRQNAEVLFDVMSSSVYAYIKLLNQLHRIDSIKLTPGQENWYQTLKDVGNDFLPTLFSDSLEHETMLAMGENQKRYFYSTIVKNKGKIKKFLTFTANAEKMFRHYLEYELNSINISNSATFLAAERHKNSEYTIFPLKKMNVLNSRSGRNAFKFLKKCRGSLFPEYLTGKNYLYIYYPLTKMKDYTIGCAVSLSEANLNKAKKQLLLTTFAILLICVIYILGSFATSYLITPLKIIEDRLKQIANGNLDQRLEIKRKDEIGLLAETVNLMQKGFKTRLQLGKFVSGTLDKSISSAKDTSKLSKPSVMKGTILFSDIRQFTTLSENYSPETIASMLNTHLDSMSAEIYKLNGEVDQFVGDAIVGFFPEKDCSQDSRLTALKAALNMNHVHKKIQGQRKKQNQFLYDIGIGLKYGTVVAGTLRSSARSEFIIIGKAKLEAEKLETLSKKGKHSKIIVPGEFKKVEIKNCRFVALANEKDVYEVIRS
jgi:class 3 adenylate cyclase